MSEAVTFDTVGGPDVLRVGPWHPAEPGPREVRLDIEYIGVNRPDMDFRSGIYLIKPTLPGSRLAHQHAASGRAFGKVLIRVNR